MLDKIILGLLQIRDLTAYDIKKAMEQSINYFYSSSFGSINPALKKLEKQKMVTCKETVENNRVKKYYKTTKKGKKMYTDWLSEPISIGRIKEDSLVRMFFMGDMDKTMKTRLLKDYLYELIETKKAFEKLRETFSEKVVPEELKEKSKFQLATLEFGIDYFQFTHDWFTEFLNKKI